MSRTNRERIFTTLTVTGVVIPVIYLASLGPVWSLISNGGSWKNGDNFKPVRALFQPAILLTNNSEAYFNYFEWWNSLHPDFNERGFRHLRNRNFP